MAEWMTHVKSVSSVGSSESIIIEIRDLMRRELEALIAIIDRVVSFILISSRTYREELNTCRVTAKRVGNVRSWSTKVDKIKRTFRDTY